MLKTSLPELGSFSFLKALNFLKYACRLFLHDQLQEEKSTSKPYASNSLRTRAGQKLSLDKKRQWWKVSSQNIFLKHFLKEKSRSDKVGFFNLRFFEHTQL